MAVAAPLLARLLAIFATAVAGVHVAAVPYGTAPLCLGSRQCRLPIGPLNGTKVETAGEIGFNASRGGPGSYVRLQLELELHGREGRRGAMAGAGDHVAGMEAGKGLAKGVKWLMKGSGACDRCCDVGRGIS